MNIKRRYQQYREKVKRLECDPKYCLKTSRVGLIAGISCLSSGVITSYLPDDWIGNTICAVIAFICSAEAFWLSGNYYERYRVLKNPKKYLKRYESTIDDLV